MGLPELFWLKIHYSHSIPNMFNLRHIGPKSCVIIRYIRNIRVVFEVSNNFRTRIEPEGESRTRIKSRHHFIFFNRARVHFAVLVVIDADQNDFLIACKRVRVVFAFDLLNCRLS